MKEYAAWVGQPAGGREHWLQLVRPREHGSWSLVLEPLLLGLWLAPSLTGVCLAAACLAGFFSRRPLKIALTDGRTERRRTARGPLAGCGAVMVAAFAGAVACGGAAWLPWLAPATVAAGFFLYFDLRGSARDEVAEIAGAIAFACVPGAMAAAAGYGAKIAGALVFAAGGRSVPTVLFVRAYLRSVKTGRNRSWPALLAAGAAVAGGGGLHLAGLMPLTPVAALAVLWCRTAIYLIYPRPKLSARDVGKDELLLGAGFVAALALTWHLPVR